MIASAEELEATREGFWRRLGYQPEPNPKYCRRWADDLSLDYYDRLLRPKQRKGA